MVGGSTWQVTHEYERSVEILVILPDVLYIELARLPIISRVEVD